MTCQKSSQLPSPAVPLISPKSEKRHHAAFSLVELMVVVGIMAIMLGIAAVSLSPSEQRAAQVTRDLVVAQINRARSHAIASGIPTAVVFSPYNSGPEKTRGKMMGLIEVKAASDAAIGYEVERVLARWEELPKQQLLLTQAAAKRSQPTVMDGEKSLTLSVGGENVSAPYLLFSREGTVLYPAGSRVEIAVAQGILENGKPRLTGKSQDGSSVDVIEVSRLSGRVRILNQTTPKP